MMETSDGNVWQTVLAQLRGELAPEDLRRWFGETRYASDSGDQITVWVTTEAIRRHIEVHYDDLLKRALRGVNRESTTIRFVVAGFGDEDDEE